MKGKVLKAFRDKLGLTQKQMAVKYEVHFNTYGAWERSRRVKLLVEMATIELARREGKSL